MNPQPTHDVHVRSTVRLISPRELWAAVPASPAATATVLQGRRDIINIITGHDRRLMMTVGPCSIHDPQAAIEYSQRLAKLAKRVNDRILVVMRVYFEKPRTTVGWKGLINDPHLNDSFDIATGLKIARQLLLQINELGLPTATEMLEPITPQYIADLLACASIGARTTESPTHRQMASGLSMPVGFKNGTDGSLQVALDAMISARTGHSFLGIDEDGNTAVINTTGNPYGYLILRGGRSGTNYDAKSLLDAVQKLSALSMHPRLVVDCSHANSEKDHRKQAGVCNEVVRQRVAGNDSIVGLMIESNLNPGTQKLTSDLSKLQYGVSITDACIGWEETEELILATYQSLANQTAPATA